MRTLALWIVFAASVAPFGAQAGPDAKPKAAPAPDKFVKAAGEAFAAASAADAKGDLATALGLYQKAYEISPHPSTAYNIGDVSRRLNKLGEAIKMFETYLALAPNAPDRKDVEALIDKLERVPSTLLLVTGEASDPNAVEFKSSYILIDGEIKLKPGAAVPKPAKEFAGRLAIAIEVTGKKMHVVDVVSSITHGTQRCPAEPGERQLCFLRAKPRVDGRVVLATNLPALQVELDKKERKSAIGQRFELPPGQHKLFARMRGFECNAVALDVAGGADVTYAFVSTKDPDGLERCPTLDVVQRKLHFE